MRAVSGFYRDPIQGAAIDLYWCRDFFAPLVDAYSYQADPNTRYDAFFELGAGHFPSNNSVLEGGDTIHFDHKWENEDEAAHDQVYDGGEVALLRHSRNDLELRQFVKLVLAHRMGQIVNDPDAIRKIRGMDAGLAASNDTGPVVETGSWVHISGVADETITQGQGQPYDEGELSTVLRYTVAHELGHLIIDARGAPGWDLLEHTGPLNGSLMADPPTRDLEISSFSNQEVMRINLRERASVQP